LFEKTVSAGPNPGLGEKRGCNTWGKLPGALQAVIVSILGKIIPRRGRATNLRGFLKRNGDMETIFEIINTIWPFLGPVILAGAIAAIIRVTRAIFTE